MVLDRYKQCQYKTQVIKRKGKKIMREHIHMQHTGKSENNNNDG